MLAGSVGAQQPVITMDAVRLADRVAVTYEASCAGHSIVSLIISERNALARIVTLKVDGQDVLNTGPGLELSDHAANLGFPHVSSVSCSQPGALEVTIVGRPKLSLTSVFWVSFPVK